MRAPQGVPVPSGTRPERLGGAGAPGQPLGVGRCATPGRRSDPSRAGGYDRGRVGGGAKNAGPGQAQAERLAGRYVTPRPGSVGCRNVRGKPGCHAHVGGCGGGVIEWPYIGGGGG